MQHLDPARTTWHITVGAYGSRLHGEPVPTVDREHNQRGTPFLPVDSERAVREHEAMRGQAVWLTELQRTFIEQAIPAICGRGDWTYRICAAPPPPEHNHVHVLLDADRARHGKDIRKWLKRWLTEEMDSQWPRPANGVWWVECGSTKPVKDAEYLNNAFNYILRQRTTPTG